MIFAHPPDLGSEDFAYYSQRTSACYIYLGCMNDLKGIVNFCHNPRFDVDEMWRYITFFRSAQASRNRAGRRFSMSYQRTLNSTVQNPSSTREVRSILSFSQI